MTRPWLTPYVECCWTPELYVVATAGHVDHGKSTLVRALTGQDPDRLEEEQRRGLSIRLGYCWTRLEGIGDVAFVDVPGHERFLATTLAGLGPVPAALFVVAADDPWMPQAAEHLAALDAIGVRHAVLAVTRCDLADPGPALAAAREQLAATSLCDAVDVAVSGRTGQGLEQLRRALAEMLHTLPHPSPDAPTRLWIDRRFHVRGTGTVVTGTLQSGSISAGSRLLSVAGEVRVRTLQCLDTPVPSIRAPARVALGLASDVPDGVTAGTALVDPGSWAEVDVVDVRLSGHDTPPPERPLLHVGSHASSVHHRPLGAGLARLTLSTPLPLRVGDRAVLRDPGNRAIWGARVLDTDPPPLNRRGAARERATVLSGFTDTVGDQLLSRGLVLRDELRRRGIDTTTLPPGTVEGAGWLLSALRATDLRERLNDLVASNQDVRGLPLAAAARALGLPDPKLVETLVTAPSLVREGRILGSEAVPVEASTALEKLQDRLRDDPFGAPDAAGLAEIGLDGGLIALLASRSLVLRLADGVVVLPDAEARAVSQLAALPQPFTVSDARRALSTSRRVALPLLAHLDRRGHTVRLPDDRRRMRTSER